MQTYGKAAPRIGAVKGEIKPTGIIGRAVGQPTLPKGKTVVKEHFRSKPKGK